MLLYKDRNILGVLMLFNVANKNLALNSLVGAAFGGKADLALRHHNC